jgi:hypothetical protein
MIKKLFTIVLILVLLVGCYDFDGVDDEISEVPEKVEGVPYFRNTVWGMTTQQVKNAEIEGELVEEDTIPNIIYKGIKVHGTMTRLVTYSFYNDDKKLNRVMCSFNVWSAEDDYDLAFEKFVTLKDVLIETYGNDYEEASQERALSNDGTEYTNIVSWHKHITTINLILSYNEDADGRMYWAGLSIIYSDEENLPWWEQ